MKDRVDSKQFHIEKGHPYPLGATIVSNGINFSVVRNEENPVIGIVLIRKQDNEKYYIEFRKSDCIGNIAAILVRDISIEEFAYNFYYDSFVELPDAYAKRVYGTQRYGEPTKTQQLSCGFGKASYDWAEDDTLRIPYEKSVFYCLHVRGFTIHSSSKIKAAGTFRGIGDKISHILSLGITAIELMPAYEFEERHQKDQVPTEQYAVEHFMEDPSKLPSLNYWGYCDAYYFAPKSSYAYTPNEADTEFKDMVRKLHKNNIEIIMQFYFPDHYKPGFILDVVKYWVTEFHIDGVHMKGKRIPITLLATEPLLANTKILYDYIPTDEIYEMKEYPAYRNLCCYKDEFMYQMRKFLKGDEDLLKKAVELIKNNPEKHAVVNFITNYYGFTLMDLVSYDKKHNEENGEQNRDGADYNYSWNCGIEGKSKKKSILLLRKKQIKNALLLVLLSQGTPLIMSGDEFLNTQNGNNNPYCQDNEISWINWNTNKTNEEISMFIKEIIRFRKEQPFFGIREEKSGSNMNETGYPEVSYHADEPWKADFGNYNRHIGIMYTRKRINTDTPKAPSAIDAVYVAYNMHWHSHTFTLPKLPKGQKWVTAITTQIGNTEVFEIDNMQSVEERSIKIFIAK